MTSELESAKMVSQNSSLFHMKQSLRKDAVKGRKNGVCRQCAQYTLKITSIFSNVPLTAYKMYVAREKQTCIPGDMCCTKIRFILYM